MRRNALNHRKHKHAGFTLMELLVVLTILGLLMSLVGPRVLNQLGGAKTKTAAIQIKDLEQAIEIYKIDVGRFPPSLDALQEQRGAKGWNGPYLKGDIPQDPWGFDYHYQYPGDHNDFDIYSLGEDGSPGGDGEAQDVNNWD